MSKSSIASYNITYNPITAFAYKFVALTFVLKLSDFQVDQSQHLSPAVNVHVFQNLLFLLRSKTKWSTVKKTQKLQDAEAFIAKLKQD